MPSRPPGATAAAVSDRQQQLTALQPRTRVGQLGHRRRVDLTPRLDMSGHQFQPKVRIGDQLCDSQHVQIVDYIPVNFYEMYISIRRSIGKPRATFQVLAWMRRSPGLTDWTACRSEFDKMYILAI
jgi:hypothetical protein